MFPPSADLDVEDLPRGTKYIPPSVVPSRSFLLRNDEYDPCGNGPWLRHYGWGLTEAFAFDYAKRHALELKLGFPDLIKLAGRPVIPLAELSDDAPEKQVAKLWANIRVMVLDVVLEHVEAQVGFSLELADPFCGDYVSMVALYNNYNIARRHWIIERISRGPIEEVIAKINKIMTPPGEQEWTPMWWYGRENPIVSAQHGRSSCCSFDDANEMICMQSIFTTDA